MNNRRPLFGRHASKQQQRASRRLPGLFACVVAAAAAAAVVLVTGSAASAVAPADVSQPSVAPFAMLGDASPFDAGATSDQEMDDGRYYEASTMASEAATSPDVQSRPRQETDIPLQLSDILPTDRRSYDKMEPPKREGKPTTVYFHVTVMSLDSIDESSMTYAADIFFSQTWQDYRLRFPDNLTADYRLLPTSWLNSMWRPDSFFKNAKKVTFQDVTIPNHYIWLYKDKSILYMVKLTLILSCSMNFHLYPHDTQQCAMKIESLSHTTDDLVFMWELKTPLVVDDRIELPQLDLVSNVTGDCTQVYSTGNFTCLEVILSFRRRLGYYLFHTYIPTCLIVVMSWISFWIRPEAVPARVTLGVTSLLTLHTQHANSQKALPPVSYLKAIDVFMSGCTVFVFCSLMEYALVNILMGDIIDGEESALKKGMKSMFMTSGAPSGSGRMPTSSQQLMEVAQQQQPPPPVTRCLRAHPPVATFVPPPTPPPTPSSSANNRHHHLHHHHQQQQQDHVRCRQHLAVEIHHPDASAPDRPEAPLPSASEDRRPANNSITSSGQACRREEHEQLMAAASLNQQLNAILPSASSTSPPPPTTTTTTTTPADDGGAVPAARHRHRTSAEPSNENGRLPLISSLHSVGKVPDVRPTHHHQHVVSGARSRLAHHHHGHHGHHGAANASLNLQQLRRSRAIAVDRISRTGFPLSFFILNVVYWCVFLDTGMF